MTACAPQGPPHGLGQGGSAEGHVTAGSDAEGLPGGLQGRLLRDVGIVAVERGAGAGADGRGKTYVVGWSLPSFAYHIGRMRDIF